MKLAIGKPSFPDVSLMAEVLRVRWLGKLSYSESWDLQQQLFRGEDNHLLLLEHDPVYTIGSNGDISNMLGDPSKLGVELQQVDRGGDVTFHGPGQLVGYPIITLPGQRAGLIQTKAYIDTLEQMIIDLLARYGLQTGRLERHRGVWVNADSDNPAKIAAIGVRLSRGRSMHGFAINVDPDLSFFGQIVPCGIEQSAVTSLRAEGIDVSVEELAKALADSQQLIPQARVDYQEVLVGQSGQVITTTEPAKSHEVPVQLKRRMDQAELEEGLSIRERKPQWMRVELQTGANFHRLKAASKELELATVCEDAGCPNIFECWNEGTATFMLLGHDCTRSCGFCQISTAKPLPVDPEEPWRVAKAVEQMGVDFAVLTMVARDDLDDGGASIVSETIGAIQALCPQVGVEVLISDLSGSKISLEKVATARPDVLNHNIETVARLQRLVRPSAGYARSLTVLARAKQMGLVTKSGLMVGLGETFDEVGSTLADLAAISVDIVTIGQYLRPTVKHLPIQRWWTPEEFKDLRELAQALGIGQVIATPLTRSSHHAGVAAAQTTQTIPG